MSGPNALPVPEESDPQAPDVPANEENVGNPPTANPVETASEDVTEDEVTGDAA